MDLKGNNLKDNGGMVIGRALRQMTNSKMSKLDLGFNEIEADGAFTLANVRFLACVLQQARKCALGQLTLANVRLLACVPKQAWRSVLCVTQKASARERFFLQTTQTTQSTCQKGKQHRAGTEEQRRAPARKGSSTVQALKNKCQKRNQHCAGAEEQCRAHARKGISTVQALKNNAEHLPEREAAPCRR